MVNCAHHSLKCQCEESDICGSFSANFLIDREVFYVHLHPLLSDFFLFSVRAGALLGTSLKAELAIPTCLLAEN